MKAPPGSLALLAARWAIAALALATALPAVRDLHVLADAHGAAHEALVEAAADANRPLRVAASCAHGGARHVEQSSTSERTRCAACVLRSPASLVPGLAPRTERLLQLGRPAVASERLVAALLASLPSSRGPPRA